MELDSPISTAVFEGTMSKPVHAVSDCLMGQLAEWGLGRVFGVPSQSPVFRPTSPLAGI